MLPVKTKGNCNFKQFPFMVFPYHMHHWYNGRKLYEKGEGRWRKKIKIF